VTRLAKALAGALLALWSLSAAAEWTVNDLMTALAVRGNANATFTERRYVPVLDAPVQSSGTLRFVAPDRLEKHTLQPRAESLVLAGDQLTLQQGQRTRSLALTDLPDNGLAINSLRGTMAGDLAALRRGWNVTLFGERRIWTLSLTPLSATVAQYIETVLIEGRQDQIDRIEIRQADGVRSVMQIEPVPAARAAPDKSR
jgi:Outer membrane lipoprotein carrier protein LolA-like